MPANVPRLIVGSEPDAPELLEWAKSEWSRFLGLALCPWTADQTTFEVTKIPYSGRAHAEPFETAACELSEGVTISLARTLTGDSEEERDLTLLHEAIHIELLRTDFLDWHRYVRKTAPSFTGGRGDGLCVEQRGHLAPMFLKLPDEIAAERYLAAHSPSLINARWKRLSKRTTTGEAAIRSLKYFGYLYDYCYAILGNELAADASLQEQLKAQATRILRDVGSEAATLIQRDASRLLDVQIEPGRFNGGTFQEFAERIKAIRC